MELALHTGWLSFKRLKYILSTLLDANPLGRERKTTSVNLSELLYKTQYMKLYFFAVVVRIVSEHTNVDIILWESGKTCIHEMYPIQTTLISTLKSNFAVSRLSIQIPDAVQTKSNKQTVVT